MKNRPGYAHTLERKKLVLPSDLYLKMDDKHVLILYSSPHPNECSISLLTLCILGCIEDIYECTLEYRQNEIKT